MAGLVGYKDGPPILSGSAYIDAISGAGACAAIVTALFHRRTSGAGIHVDISQLEIATTFMASVLLDYQFTNRVAPRRGNDSDVFAPYGCYRCRGKDQWIAISVESDRDWKNFRRAIGTPAWTASERFVGALGRWNNREELNGLVSAWTKDRDKHEVMTTLQAAGVPAGALLNASELMADPHFAAQEFFVTLPHPAAGTHVYPGLPFVVGEGAGTEWMPAPRLGEHNGHVFQELLGLDDGTIQELSDRGIIGTIPVPGKQAY
jgi:crotonobetainyl-CoA:carnitine CoA-transferase CaiB-like acyl-CoA transferase